MTTHAHTWLRPLPRLWLWLSTGSGQTVHSAPSSAVPDDSTDRMRAPHIFTLLFPVPTSATLSVELVPATCWRFNVRDHATHEQWDQLHRATYRQAPYCCEICGGRGPEWPVECHEVRHYDNTDRVQTLVRLIALCPAYHRTKHQARRSHRTPGWSPLSSGSNQ